MPRRRYQRSPSWSSGLHNARLHNGLDWERSWRLLDSRVDFNYSSVLMRQRLGEFEQVLLLALAGLDAGVSGVDVREYIESRTGRLVSPGAIYTAFQRLERRGLVVSSFGEPTPRRGGKRPKLYRLRAEGARTLRDMESVLVRLGYRLTPRIGSR
jgi:PadR family transcriptional regulator PadR